MPKKTKLAGDPVEIARRLQHTQVQAEQVRLRALLMAVSGRYTLEEIGEKLNKGRATVARWLRAYRTGGIEKAMERRTSSGRRPQISQGIIDELKEGLESNRWPHSQDIQSWLEETHGITLPRATFYFWLRRARDETAPFQKSKPPRRSSLNPSKRNQTNPRAELHQPELAEEQTEELHQFKIDEEHKDD